MGPKNQMAYNWRFWRGFSDADDNVIWLPAGPRHPIAPNRLKSDPPATAPDQVWVAETTYVWTVEGWVYLATVMDMFSRKIVGWSLSQSLETSLVNEALERAQKERRPHPGLLHHSDRGSQHASSAFRALLHSWQMEPSMSGPACCYDNAAMESFWSTLKTELIDQN